MIIYQHFAHLKGGKGYHRGLLRVLFPEDSDTETIVGASHEKNGSLLDTFKGRLKSGRERKGVQSWSTPGKALCS